MPTPPLRLAPLTPHQRNGAGSSNSPSPVLRSPRSPRHLPLLSLTPHAVGPADDEQSGEEDLTIKEIWNVISRAADVVKDGDRLENLAWRHWGQPKHARRSSVSSADTASSISLQTPTHEQPPPLARSRSFEKRSFGGMLKLLVEENEFRDWVEDAKQRRQSITSTSARSPSPGLTALPTPYVCVPHTPEVVVPVFASELDTPVADVEFRVVEPTPVPSRVGSLGGSVGAGGLLARAAAQPSLNEEEEEQLGGGAATGSDSQAESSAAGAATATRHQRSPRKRGNRFFIQSSPSKLSGSGSESSQPSPIATFAPAMDQLPVADAPVAAAPPAAPHAEPVPAAAHLTTSPDPDVVRASPQRRSSAESSSAIVMRGKRSGTNATGEKRHVSIATMRGKFAGEKARAAEVIDARNKVKGKGRDTEAEKSSDWEDDEDDDDDEGWEDDEVKEKAEKPAPAPPVLLHRRTSSRSNTGGGMELTRQLSRPTMQRKSSSGNTVKTTAMTSGAAASLAAGHPATAPSTAPPVKPMSKKERKAELARAEAERDAQRKREMFAKQQIFGSKAAGEGLLTGIFRTGKSMVDLTQAGQEHDDVPLRRAPTHANLSMARSPIHAAPALLRSKSAVAMPVQTGVSVTGSIHQHDDEDKGQAKKRSTGIVMESSDDDSEDEDDQYLASSQVRRKIDELAARRDKRTTTPQPPALGAVAGGTTTPLTTTPKLDATPAQAVPVQVAGTVLNLDENGVVRPMSPTARRRVIIMREMSESLRRNIILEREKSAGGGGGIGGGNSNFGHTRPPPGLHTSKLPTSSSAINLTQLGQAHGGGGSGLGARQSSHPDLTTAHEPHSHPHERDLHPHHAQYQSHPHYQSNPQLQAQSQSHQSQSHLHNPPSGLSSNVASNHPDPTRRRTTPSVLGGGYLRPLTRVGDRPATAGGVTTVPGSAGAGVGVGGSGSGMGGGPTTSPLAQDAGVSRPRSAAQLSMSPVAQGRHSPLLGSGTLHHPHPHPHPHPQGGYPHPNSHAHAHVQPHAHPNTHLHGSHAAAAAAAAHSRSLVEQAHPMVRRLTDGDHKDLERARIKRELAKRSETMDTSYRLHGW